MKFGFTHHLLGKHQGAIRTHIDHDLADVLERLVRGFAGRDGNIHLRLHAAHAEGDDEEGDENKQHIHQGDQIIHRAFFDMLLGAEFHDEKMRDTTANQPNSERERTVVVLRGAARLAAAAAAAAVTRLYCAASNAMM